ncbi:MAG: helix-turn-helix domain-containing protein [Clostridia bacterium]|nr:helix-turn-helix domain-containing protein [Clostridia bacterium]
MQPEFYYKHEHKHTLTYGEGRDPQCPFNFHSPIELYLILEGEVEVWINDHQKLLKAGELSVALSYDAHSYRGKEGSRVVYMIIPAELCGEFMAALGNKRTVDPFVSCPAAFEKMKACYEAIKQSTNELQVRGYLNVLLGTLLEQLKLEERHEPVDPQRSAQILIYLNDHYKEDLSLGTVAAALGYNPSYLSRYFKANFHTSFNRYLTMLRLRQAVLLMKERNHSIDYCAFESGFNSMRTFYRVFAREFQCTPKEYLKK